MMEALEPGAVISQVARRHDMGPQQLFGWLREARKAAEANTAAFVPVVVEVPAAGPTAAPKRRAVVGARARG